MNHCQSKDILHPGKTCITDLPYCQVCIHLNQPLHCVIFGFATSTLKTCIALATGACVSVLSFMNWDHCDEKRPNSYSCHFLGQAKGHCMVRSHKIVLQAIRFESIYLTHSLIVQNTLNHQSFVATASSIPILLASGGCVHR